MKNNKNPTRRHPRPFPWTCSTCGKVEVRDATIPHTAKVKHHGREYTVEVSDLPVLRCAACHAIVMQNDSHDRIFAALRHRLGLLQPDEIRQQRKERGLKQSDLAREIQAASTTVCKWESGTIIQSHRSDKALRNYFAKTTVKLGTVACDAGSSPKPPENDAAKVRSLIDACMSKLLSELPSDKDRSDLLARMVEHSEDFCERFGGLVRTYGLTVADDAARLCAMWEPHQSTRLGDTIALSSDDYIVVVDDYYYIVSGKHQEPIARAAIPIHYPHHRPVEALIDVSAKCVWKQAIISCSVEGMPGARLPPDSEPDFGSIPESWLGGSKGKNRICGILGYCNEPRAVDF